MNDHVLERIATISPEKRELLKKLLKEEGVDLERSWIVPQSRDRDSFPVSFAQERLWFLDQLVPGSSMYNIPLAVCLHGRLHLATLEKAINELVCRHEILRTTFTAVDGQPVQVIGPHLSIPLPVVDSTDLPDTAVRQLIATEAQQPFDLARGPLFRVMLLRRGLEDHILLLTMHHIISDGWSLNVMVREIGMLYAAFQAGQPSPLPPLPVQYADFACWQRQWLQGDALDQQLAYWKKQLANSPPLLQLPTDRPRTAVKTSRGACHRFVLSAQLTHALKNLSQHEGDTLFMTLLAAFQTLLYRYTGQADICVGTPIANRNRSEIEDLVGFFVNTLVIRTDFSAEPTFCRLLEQVRETTLDAYAHQDLPFEVLVEVLHPERNLSHTPLFQVMFTLQNAAGQPPQLSGLSILPLETEKGIATFDLTLLMRESTAGLSGVIEYNADLFNAATIVRLAEHLETLLTAVVANPHRPVTTLPLLTAAEQQQLLGDWNDTAVSFPLDEPIHKQFEAQVERTPTHIALVCRDAQLTYAALNRRANQLAHYLQKQGVGPESIVAIYTKRSPEMIVAILGILKAGGAYLPLDPSYPAERLALMLEDAQPAALLTEEQAMDGNLPLTINHLPVIILDTDWPTIAWESAANPTGTVTPDNLAYVIFTSGSTGRPKGTLLHHRGLSNLSQAYMQQLELETSSRVLQFFSFGFDGSVGDIFPTLLSGAALHLPPRETLQAIPDLHRYLQEAAVTHILMTPSMLAVLPVHDLPHLRVIVAGGEQLAKEVAARWLPGRAVINAYGPTEVTVVSVWYKACAEEAFPEAAVSIPIGRPVGNTQLYVLDQNRQPVPRGVPGELYIGGVQVARGYLGRPTLTAERFVPLTINNSLITEYRLPTIVYRTGDLVRYLPDGNLEFLERIDHQVKIRGFRIELGEIESVLRRHEGLETAVAIVREDEPGQKQLVAYVIPQAETGPTAQELHAYLQDRLPGYMIPTAFVTLEALPRLPNGKVDRCALPMPSGSREEMAGAYVAPRTATEDIVAGVWAEVLNVAQVGVLDNFFDLGGHSLLATRLVSRIRQLFQVDLPLRDLFEAATVAALAQRIDTARQDGAVQEAPTIQPMVREAVLPLSFAQQRLWFLHQLEPDSPDYNVPDAVRLTGRLDVAALRASLNEIVRRHEILRTTFVSHEEQGEPRQHIAPELTLSMPVIDLRHLPAAEREAEAMQLAQLEAQRPFDLSHGPLIRVTLIQLDDEEHLALLSLHHIVADGWSMGVLVRELGAIYTAVCQNQPVNLPNLPIQYADFACWQRQWLQEEALQKQLGYWQQQLANCPPRLELPTDRPRPAVQTANGAHQSFVLPPELVQKLHRLGREEGVTLFMTLLTAFQALLYRYTGQTDICVGTPIANRNRAEIEGLIGCFINTLVLRTDLADRPTFRQLLTRVRQVALDAYAHQDLPFDRVVDALQPERNLSHTPLFQVMFILQNAPLGQIELPDLTLARVPLDTGIANFDLTLVMEEGLEGLIGAVEYNTDLFDDSTIVRLIDHFQMLLQGATAVPDQPIATLPLLTAAEQQQILLDWNDTAVPRPDSCLHELITVQAEQTPTVTAVQFGRQQLTYAQLNQRANQLAHHLQKHGIGPDTLVGIALDRSLEMITALLAVLKAGGAYLPLDPSYPAERLAFMLQDAKPVAVLTQEKVVAGDKLQVAGEKSQFTILDTEWPIIAQESDQNPVTDVSPDNLAYVIYTSGSTGQPKGVPVSHRAVLNHNLAIIDECRLQPNDRVWQFATINFDTAVEEIFPTLLAGATLVLREPEIPLTADLCRLITAEQLTVLDLPTAYWHDWVRELGQSRRRLPDCLRLVIVGGDKALTAVYHKWREVSAGTAVIYLNTYGPTETTVISTLYRPTGELDGELPIGLPIANTSVYVLDRDRQAVPIGVPGELCIGGLGLARGYLNRPALTAERFVPLPVNSSLATEYRLPTTVYRTGDLVRWRSDGNLEFLGRVDEQVKIRGFRVEPGEVEAVLMQCPAVGEAAVIPHTTDNGSVRLVAYVVPAAETAPTVDELRRCLREKLPDYMVPALFVTLDEIPYFPNGKINRRALPAPDQSRPELTADFAPPTTPKEETLAQIWRTVLGLDEVGIHDNFFELGGDSILSIQVIARANQSGLHLTPRQFFAGPTVAQLAAAAGEAQVVQAEQGLVEGSVPLTPIQRWFFDQDLPQRHHWNQAVLLDVRQPLSREWLETAVSHLMQHHDALRLRFSQTEQGWQQVNAGFAETVPLSWIDLSDISEVEQEAAVTSRCAELQASLHLSQGPLLRLAYFDLGQKRSARLFIAVHHLAIDGVSWRILLEDLQTAYGQLSQEQPVQLPSKTTAFRHWAQRLQVHAASEGVEAERLYWLNLNRSPAPSLPCDFAGSEAANNEASAQTISVSLNQEETEALLRQVPAAYRTDMNDALLTALAQTMQQWTGQRCLLVDLESHGRADLFADVDLSRTVGWFTAVYPVKLTLPTANNPGDVLTAVKEQLRAVPRQGIGYGLLRYLSPDEAVRAQLAVQPLAEISFNYLGQFDQALPESSPFAPAPESRGPDRSPKSRRTYLLDVTGTIVDGRLHVAWTYSVNTHRRTTIEQAAQIFIDKLRALIAHCQATEAGGLTPSDVPLANLDQKKLNKLLAKMKQAS